MSELTYTVICERCIRTGDLRDPSTTEGWRLADGQAHTLCDHCRAHDVFREVGRAAADDLKTRLDEINRRSRGT